MIWQVISPTGGFGGIELVKFDSREQSVMEMLPEVTAQVSAITGLRVFPSLSSSLPSPGQSDVEMVVQSTDCYENMAAYAQQLVAGGTAERAVPVYQYQSDAGSTGISYAV